MKIIWLYTSSFLLIYTIIQTIRYLWNEHFNPYDYFTDFHQVEDLSYLDKQIFPDGKIKYRKHKNLYFWQRKERRLFLVSKISGSIELKERSVWVNVSTWQAKRLERELKPKTPD